MSTIHQIVIVATVAAFIILLLGKTGLREKIRNFHDKIDISIVADMLDCNFCLSFWTCLAVAIVAVWLTDDVHWFISIVCSPPITRILL